MTFSPGNSQSSFLPIEFDITSNEEIFRELIAKRERLTASILNIKENAQYEKRELLTAQQWFSSYSSGAIKTNYSYRLTFDLVALNGGNIPNAATTTLALSATTQPALISVPNSIQPLHGFGAVNNGANFFFLNDPLVYVRTNVWTAAVQQISITNNTGAALTQAVWVLEYLKF